MKLVLKSCMQGSSIFIFLPYLLTLSLNTANLNFSIDRATSKYQIFRFQKNSRRTEFQVGDMFLKLNQCGFSFWRHCIYQHGHMPPVVHG